jgi:hypothetical protein
MTAERDVLTDVPAINACVSSSIVASGRSATSRSRASATSPRMGETFPPPWARGATDAVSRCRRNTRLTVASPTPSNAAIAAYVSFS